MKKHLFLKSLLIAIGLLVTSLTTRMWATTWTVAGSSNDILKSNGTWDPTKSGNDLTNVTGNYWALEITGKSPSSSSYTFKICQDHAWTTAYPTSNYEFNNVATGSGTTILYTFNSSTHDIKAYGFKTWRVVGTTAATGSNWDASDTKNNMSKGGNVYTYTLTKKNMNLAASTTYEFKIIKDGAYTVSFPANNKTFTVATAGRYDITYTIDLSTQTVSVSTTPSTYSITLDKNGGTADGSATATYNSTSLSSISAPTRANYHVEGYYTNAACATKVATSTGALQSGVSGYTTGTKWTKASNATLYAKWEGDTWGITWKDQGNTTYSGSNKASLPSSYRYGTGIPSLTAGVKTGYTFGGWFDNSACTGAAVTSISSSATGAKTFYAKWTANTYTVSFDVNDGTASTPAPKEVTYGAAYGTLPSGMTHTSKQFIGWYDAKADGAGNHITAASIVRTADDHTLYAHYENVYSVNVTFKCGSTTIYPATSVNASPTSLAPTITAPEIFGYSFVNWTGSNVTFGNENSATTTVNATAATTVTANYNVVPTVYFKNNLGWDSVFVSFDCSFVEGKDNVPSNNGKLYYKMTQIGSSDIYSCVIPSDYTDDDYAGWAWNIAFDNTNYGKTATTTHTGTWSEFYGGECVGRGDFDPKATLYIPYSGESQSRNNTKFYQTGCWMKYNSTESGYQVNMNTIVTGSNADTCTVKLTAASAGGYEFSAKIKLRRANYTYGFKLYKINQKNTNDLWYTNTGTIYANTETLPWDFHSGTEDVTSTSTRCGLHTEALGDYTITVSFGTGRPMVTVEYPASEGDWKLVYKDRATWSNGAHTASWSHPSRVIKAKANAVDTVSFYVSKATGANASVELQKCTAINPSTGAETWEKQGSNLNLSSITGTGIYNFKVTQNGSKVASAAVAGGYEGNFYIRTDVSDGGWTNYKNASNVMTYSEFAENNSGFTHYFMRYVETGLNIKFCIANDYSECISDTLVNDTYTGEHIATYGNVRFMWDHRTNKVSRAYISGSTYVRDRFLVLEGDAKMFDEKGKALTTAGGGKISGLNDYEMKFIDDQNWIYEATVKAQPTARIKLTAKYNNKIQYFYGAEGARTDENTELLLGGSDTNKYKIRVVYDFKTNRLIKAFIPDGAIGTDLAIKADLMIIREHQDDAHQVTFSGSGKLSEVKTVYGAMKFNKYTVNGKSKESGHAATGDSRYKRDLFYISFPFDVKLNEAFGFGTYGKHWIIEYYDGKGRAANGFWAESGPNWKFVTPSERNAGYTMKAFEGYILALDLDELTESSDVWNNGVENVYIYFPSDGNVNDIQATNRLIPISQEGYECTIDRSAEIGGSGEPLGPEYNRTIKDSYWHCIGVPSFANYSRDLYETNGGTKIDWRSTSMPYLYEWNWADNTLSVTSSATFDFKATWSYLVQYAGEHIYWSAVNVTPAPIVARERTAPKNAEFRIELQQAGKKADQTFVRLTDEENITTGFDFNYDLSKEFNKNKANIYTMVTTVKEDGPSITEVAGNVQPMTEQTTVVPMGVTIAKAGEYTISIPSGTSGIGVTLVDNETGIRTNLALEDYTVALEAGTQNDRFYLEISPIKHVATGVEEITGDGSQVTGARKVMVDGILYIIKDGKVFSTQGARVK